jgi:hypothetical protein
MRLGKSQPSHPKATCYGFALEVLVLPEGQIGRPGQTVGWVWVCGGPFYGTSRTRGPRTSCPTEANKSHNISSDIGMDRGIRARLHKHCTAWAATDPPLSLEAANASSP